MLEPGTAGRAEREYQGVVLELVAPHGVNDATVSLEPLEAVLPELNTYIARDLVQRIAPRLAVGEGFAHSHRAVDELRIGGQQRGGDPFTRQVPERERSLERGDAAAGDHDLERRRVARCHGEYLRDGVDVVPAAPFRTLIAANYVCLTTPDVSAAPARGRCAGQTPSRRGCTSSAPCARGPTTRAPGSPAGGPRSGRRSRPSRRA